MGLLESEGNCLKYPKRGWNRKEGRGTKILKRGESWVKRWVLEPPYELWYGTFIYRERIIRYFEDKNYAWRLNFVQKSFWILLIFLVLFSVLKNALIPPNLHTATEIIDSIVEMAGTISCYCQYFNFKKMWWQCLIKKNQVNLKYYHSFFSLTLICMKYFCNVTA